MFRVIIATLVFAVFISANLMPAEAKPKDTPLCTVCEYAVTYLENQIKSNSTENEIIKAIENVCKIAPASAQASCDSLIEEYGPTIIYLLVKAANPEEICKAVKAC